ncbi:MAG: CRISPR-associated endonuclease Cas2, partial [Casimicrobiaceae bacterium]|nr:CRISPR-associated endonuclease Cas2 [Casimicrobiaceae bacterium]
MLVFFDLPVVTRAERQAYAQFRRFLLNDGFDMIQLSVYGRILNGRDAEEKHLQRVIAN